MTRPSIYFAAAAFVVLAGVAGYEAQVASRQNQTLAALRTRAAQLAAESAALRHQRDTAAQDLATAERQLATLPAPRPDDPGFSAERRSEMRAWLGRVKKLHQLFAERPNQRIPEMQFLTDQDWLRVAKNARFDTEEETRRVLAALRDAAVENFTPQLSAALRRFVKSPAVDDPANIYTLVPLLEKPVESALLDRYELVKGLPEGLGLGGKTSWTVQTKMPVDADYDSRFHVAASDSGSYGASSDVAPEAWIPDFRGRLTRAAKDYAAANKGASASGLAEVLPYFNPPLDPGTTERIIKAEREHGK